MNEFKSLLPDAEDYNRREWHPLPIVEKEPLKGSGKWTDRKGTIADQIYLQKYFCNNQDVRRVAILLDSIKFGFALDVDGAAAMEVFRTEIMHKLSIELRDKINATTHTRTANGGYHWLFEILRQDFPKGITQGTYWTSIQNGHAEIKVIGTNQYLIERGDGYEPIRGIESLITLSQQDANEFLSVLDTFDKETKAIRKVGSKLVPYWTQPKRHDVALYTAGFLYKNGVPKYLACALMEHIIDIAALSDDNLQRTLSRVEGTYAKDLNSEPVAGYTKLIEIVDDDESVITTIQKEFDKLGYHFSVKEVHQKEKKEIEKISTIALGLIEGDLKTLFKNQFDVPFATVEIDGHLENLPIKGTRFEMWVSRTYYDKEAKTISNEALKEVCSTLFAKALLGTEVMDLDLRIASTPISQDSSIYYDLTNKNWEAVKITKDGWSIEQSSAIPTVFRRFSNQRPQVYPIASGAYSSDVLDQFLDLIHVSKDKSVRLLFKCYIITLFIPKISKAALMLHGPAGSAKTTCQDLIKLLVDPSILTSLTFPMGIEPLIQQLSHNYISFYDNVSVLKDWLSDALCRAITGTAFSKRELYSNDDDILYQFIRCVGFNGINLAATKADLLDRGIIMEVDSIESKDIREFAGDILPEFEKIKPQLLAFIFDTLVKVLRIKTDGKQIKLKTKSRMADFEKHAEMISQALGYEPNKFVEAYQANKKLGVSEVLEGSPLARVIIHVMQRYTVGSVWSGSASRLLKELEPIASEELDINIQKERLWPKRANMLSRRLKEIKSNLKQVGIVVSEKRDPITRLKTIEIGKVSSESSESSEPQNRTENERESGDDTSKSPNDTTNDPNDTDRVSSDKRPENHAQDTDPNDTNDPNDTVPGSRGGESNDPDSLHWSVGTPEQSKAFNDEYERLQREGKEEA